jgi:hypothetical protein
MRWAKPSTWPTVRFHIEAATGRIIDYELGDLLRVASETGAWDAMAGPLQQRAPATQPLSGAEAMTSVVEAVIREVAGGFADNPATRDSTSIDRAARPLAALMTAAMGPVLVPAAGATAPDRDDPRDRFAVPVDPEQMRGGGIQFLAMLGTMLSDDVAPRGSWLWTTWRETCLLLGSARFASGRELARLDRENAAGPLACLVIARSPLGWDADVRSRFVRVGLDHLTADALVKDLSILWTGDTVTARAATGALEELRKMNAADVKAIDALLPQEWRGTLVDLDAGLKASRDPTPSRSVPGTIKQIWEARLRGPLERALKASSPGENSRPDDLRRGL